MSLLNDLKKIYANDGKIEELNMSTGNQKAIDHYSLQNQDIEAGLLATMKKQGKQHDE